MTQILNIKTLQCHVQKKVYLNLKWPLQRQLYTVTTKSKPFLNLVQFRNIRGTLATYPFLVQKRQLILNYNSQGHKPYNQSELSIPPFPIYPLTQLT